MQFVFDKYYNIIDFVYCYFLQKSFSLLCNSSLHFQISTFLHYFLTHHIVSSFYKTRIIEGFYRSSLLGDYIIRRYSTCFLLFQCRFQQSQYEDGSHQVYLPIYRKPVDNTPTPWDSLLDYNVEATSGCSSPSFSKFIFKHFP